MSGGGNAGDLVVASDAGELAALAAERVAASIQRAVAERGRASVAISGGETPRATYRRLATLGLPWERVDLFWVDDRFVPYDSPRSNYGEARRDWLARTPIPAASVHPMPPEGPDHEAAARTYEDELLALVGRPPVLDLAILGVGDDGHTASLFPGTPALSEAERAVVAVAGEGAREPRITLTFPVLVGARELLVLAQGAGKRGVIAAARDRSARPIPAQRLLDAQGVLTWIVDRSAAGA